MTIRCLAMDDEPLALEKMAGYISKTPFLKLEGACRSGFEAMEFLAEGRIDLIFADINMPDINGMDFIKSLHDKPQVIFTTAFSEYALEGFKVNALDYLLKPIGYTEFLRSANKAKNYFDILNPQPEQNDDDRNYLFVKSDYKIVRINLNNILYIEGMREYVRIHLETGKAVMPLISLRVLEEQLPANSFMRVHRSYIVNLQKITTIDHSRIVFGDKVYIPVSEQYRDFFQKFLSEHSLG
jgi:two-component system, LytTR family, response regulator LytT